MKLKDATAGQHVWWKAGGVECECIVSGHAFRHDILRQVFRLDVFMMDRLPLDTEVSTEPPPKPKPPRSACGVTSVSRVDGNRRRRGTAMTFDTIRKRLPTLSDEEIEGLHSAIQTIRHYRHKLSAAQIAYILGSCEDTARRLWVDWQGVFDSLVNDYYEDTEEGHNDG